MTPALDWISATFPRDILPEVVRSVAPVLERSGAAPYADARGWSLGGGSVQVSTRNAVGIVSASGGVVAGLRAAGLLLDYLSAISQHPHGVSRLDACVDVPAHARDVLPSVLAAGRAGLVSLSRKSIQPDQVRRHDSLDPDGVPAGTVYLGNRRTHDVTARVYCKRSELVDHGHSDPGPLTRYELTVKRGVGATLRDAADPAPLFWHYMGGLLPRPAGVPDWRPYAQGFDLPPRPAFDPAARLRRLVEEGAFDSALRLASDLGPRGLDFVGMLLARRHAVLAQPSAPGRVCPPALDS